ncbi:hypothetical protein EDB84DRAFT_1674518 [Lactarius hengduanensis]|nr:hypothetical protein EDB84DRAFT_1674518 [Lactarius hengduanensis]
MSDFEYLPSATVDQPAPTLLSTPPAPSSISSTFLPSPARLETEDHPEPESASTPPIALSSLIHPLTHSPSSPSTDDVPEFAATPTSSPSISSTFLSSPVRSEMNNQPESEHEAASTSMSVPLLSLPLSTLHPLSPLSSTFLPSLVTSATDDQPEHASTFSIPSSTSFHSDSSLPSTSLLGSPITDNVPEIKPAPLGLSLCPSDLPSHVPTSLAPSPSTSNSQLCFPASSESTPASLSKPLELDDVKLESSPALAPSDVVTLSHPESVPVVARRDYPPPARATRSFSNRSHSTPFDTAATTARIQDSRLGLLHSRSHTGPRLANDSFRSATARIPVGLLRSLVDARASLPTHLTPVDAVSLWLSSLQLRVRFHHHGSPCFDTLQRLDDPSHPRAQVLEQARRHRQQSDRHLQDIQVIQHLRASASTRAAHAPRPTPRIRPRRPGFKFQDYFRHATTFDNARRRHAAAAARSTPIFPFPFRPTISPFSTPEVERSSSLTGDGQDFDPPGGVRPAFGLSPKPLAFRISIASATRPLRSGRQERHSFTQLVGYDYVMISQELLDILNKSWPPLFRPDIVALCVPKLEQLVFCGNRQGGSANFVRGGVEPEPNQCEPEPMVQFGVRPRPLNRTNGPVRGSGKKVKEPNRTEPYHHYLTAFAISCDLGIIQATQDPIVWAVGYTVEPALNYTDLTATFLDPRSLYYRIQYLNDWSLVEHNNRTGKYSKDAAPISGLLGDLVSFATAQVYGSIQLTVPFGTYGHSTQPDAIAFMKNMGGLNPVIPRWVNALETLYSAFLALMYIDPKLGGLFLEPLFRLQASPIYTSPYAAPDLAILPIAKE